MMLVGYNCHPPSPLDRLEDYGASIVRVPLRSDLPDDEIARQMERLAGRPDLLPMICCTTLEKSVDAVRWHAVRTYHLARDAGVPAFQRDRTDGLIELGNEEDLNLEGAPDGGFKYRPREYGDASVTAYEDLRAAGYEGLIAGGSVSNFGSALSDDLVTKLKRFGLSVDAVLARADVLLPLAIRLGLRSPLPGMLYLRLMDWSRLPSDMIVSPHYYATDGDPNKPRPNHESIKAEWTALTAIIGDRPVIIGELGATDNDRTPEAAAAIYAGSLDRWAGYRQVIAAIAYIWTEGEGTPEAPALHCACMQGHADGSVTEKPQGAAIRDWVKGRRTT